MATYKTAELLSRLSELINDGYEYVDVSTLESDEEFPESLHFDAIECRSCSVDYEEIESVELPEDYDYENSCSEVTGTDFCFSLPFTYNEISHLSHSVDNALQFVKERIKDPTYTKDEISDMKNSAIQWRNLQAKFAKFRKHFGIRQK